MAANNPTLEDLLNNPINNPHGRPAPRVDIELERNETRLGMKLESLALDYAAASDAQELELDGANFLLLPPMEPPYGPMNFVIMGVSYPEDNVKLDVALQSKCAYFRAYEGSAELIPWQLLPGSRMMEDRPDYRYVDGAIPLTFSGDYADLAQTAGIEGVENAMIGVSALHEAVWGEALTNEQKAEYILRIIHMLVEPLRFPRLIDRYAILDPLAQPVRIDEWACHLHICWKFLSCIVMYKRFDQNVEDQFPLDYSIVEFNKWFKKKSAPNAILSPNYTIHDFAHMPEVLKIALDPSMEPRLADRLARLAAGLA
ncbi:hypothetical protein Tsubulata_025707 [Turnera subulata]|uniref:rRNA N-glycosylase n=1 Tax=Turnera subulata TaxID=218843 RepID=A0A9Q0FQF5_9ROSI|nr:hypothetical protein Tsubulata_025707 [Turnera subulata]